MSQAMQLFPDMAPWEYDALLKSIDKYGLLLPVVKDEKDVIIDGHQRERACRELGITDYRVELLVGLTEDEKRDRAYVLNCVRRHLNQCQIRELIAAELKRTPDLSSNWLAQILGTTDKTVGDVRKKLIATSEIPTFEKHRGKDGKSRPVTRVSTNNLKEQNRAREAIRSLGEEAPKRPIELRLLERKAARKTARDRVSSEPSISLGEGAIRLYHCPFQQFEETTGIGPSSVNLLLTDIPYDGQFLDQLPQLGELAERILVPGGLFVTYCGQFHLDRVMSSLGERLSYGWMRASVWRGVGVVIHPRQATSKWKPILVYSKGGWTTRKRWQDLTRSRAKEKRWHRWQQPLDEVERLIRDFSRPGDLIVDPCGGGFTTAIACQWLGDRRCVSVDIDGEAVRNGIDRLASEGISDTRQDIREILTECESTGEGQDDVIRIWIDRSGRTSRAFNNYLRDLGPEWVKRFKALGLDRKATATGGPSRS